MLYAIQVVDILAWGECFKYVEYWYIVYVARILILYFVHDTRTKQRSTLASFRGPYMTKLVIYMYTIILRHNTTTISR